MLKVKGPDSRTTLAAMSVRKPARKKAKKGSEGPRVTTISIPFYSSEQDNVRLVVSNGGETMVRPVVKLGAADLWELGPTRFSWTDQPRSIVRGIQKNIFKTRVMRPLILAGIILLAIARRRRALVILLAVPVYYLCTHAAFSTEYRYILAIHYFLFVFAAVFSFWAWEAVSEVMQQAYRSLRHRVPRAAPDQA